jgi:hypothetical protein
MGAKRASLEWVLLFLLGYLFVGTAVAGENEAKKVVQEATSLFERSVIRTDAAEVQG